MSDDISLTLPPLTAGRLDKVLLEILRQSPDYACLSRSKLQFWIEEGNVLIDNKQILKSSTSVEPGQVVTVTPPPFEPQELSTYDLQLDVIFEDNDLVVINKPPDLTLHPGAGNRDKTLVNALVARYGQRYKNLSQTDRPGVVHRLDKNTTGVVVVALTERAFQGLVPQFAEHTVKRQYKALIRTLPRATKGPHSLDSGTINAPIGRHPQRRTEMAVLEKGGKNAVTHWDVVERFVYGSLVRVKLETGRTHQIRVHMNYIDCPVIGDVVYGDFNMLPTPLLNASIKFGRQALHAEQLGFKHPINNEELLFESPIPEDMAALIKTFEEHS